MQGEATAFEMGADGTRLTIVDRIQRKQFTLRTGTSVSPDPTSTDRFPVPLDSAVELETTELWWESNKAVYLRESDGTLVAETPPGSVESVGQGTYIVEIQAPVRVYLRIEGPFDVEAGTERVDIELEGSVSLALGARSLHTVPSGTIVTTDAVEDMMTTVSHLGSALKTTSPERSFPTLRGHPPRIALGDERQIPDGIEAPETGIRLEIPPTLEHVYEVAPLAFYLGARVVPGETPRLATADGFEYELAHSAGFHGAVEQTLKQVFFLDCLTRVDGYYDVPLHEREVLDGVLDLDFASLYDEPVASQVRTYLTVPFETIEPHVPAWKATVHLEPEPESISHLPFAVHDLALVRVGSPAELTVAAEPEVDAVAGGGGEDVLYRAISAASGNTETALALPETASLQDIWYGSGIPVDASKGLADAHAHHLERTPSDGPISIAVVQNEAAMGAEGDLESVYQGRDLPFEVSLYHDLTADELEGLLQSDHDFLHYIGHVGEEGIDCADGRLDTRTVDEVAIDAFLLNACQSYEQGVGLIQAGSIGGVVTINDVVNAEAVTVGKNLAKLLYRGFPLSVARDLATAESVIGDLYLTLGDGEVTLTQTESGAALYGEITTSGAVPEADVIAYPTRSGGMGSMLFPNLPENDVHYLNSGRLDLSTEAVMDSFSLEDMPVLVDGRLFWSQDEEFEAVLPS